jgi:hypothetical protein
METVCWRPVQPSPVLSVFTLCSPTINGAFSKRTQETSYSPHHVGSFFPLTLRRSVTFTEFRSSLSFSHRVTGRSHGDHPSAKVAYFCYLAVSPAMPLHLVHSGMPEPHISKVFILVGRIQDVPCKQNRFHKLDPCTCLQFLVELSRSLRGIRFPTICELLSCVHRLDTGSTRTSRSPTVTDVQEHNIALYVTHRAPRKRH